MEKNVVVTETKMSDPTALGVFGLSMVTFVAASQKMGWTSGTTFVLPWAIFLGALAQIWASTVDFKKNNYFGSIVLGVYGLFWMGVAMHWAISLGWFGEVDSLADPKQLAFAFFGYLIFSIFITVAAFETNKVFAAILVLIDVLFISLGLATLGINAALFSKLAAISEFSISLLGFYACGAIFLNNFFERKVLSLGAPFGFLKKGTAASSMPVAKRTA
ncbi:acetate uptake transporter [Ammoniphilus sp. 3BR4]|uniref:acetate uptake transporter n=1 Tax=Ammoniphilus sp. 3BR4 TaxID=3158265 RepID=UPI0034672316